MITIQYGGWTPDLANVAFQMPDQEGPVIVPVADCLNVYFANGTYQSLPNPAATLVPALISPALSALTYLDSNGLAIPLFGASNNNVYYENGPSSGLSLLLNVSGATIDGWNFAQFGQQLFVQALATQAYVLNAPSGANLIQVTPGGSTVGTYIAGAPYATVLGVVGQFLMVGDIQDAESSTVIGTGNGSITTFTGNLPAPLYPTSVNVSNTGTGGGTGSDNGQGVITGTGIASGTVNYDNGFIDIVFTTPVSSGGVVTADSALAFRARLAWSPIGNANPPGGWPPPLTNAALAVQSGIQDLEYAYGPIMFISGYPLYGVIFQRNAITRASYIGGNVVFSWQTYARNQGLLAKGAAIQVGANTYFLSDAGFFYTDGANVIPIGTAQDNSAGIDGWFFANVNKAALAAIRSGYDASKRCIFFAIPTGSNTLPDTLLTYNLLAGKWTRATVATETIWTDTDGFTDRLGVITQTTHQYSLLTGTPSSGYLESCDLSFADGNTRFTPSVRPNIACSDTPTAQVGVRSTLKSSITYSAAGTADAFGAGFAPTLTGNGLYTRLRVSSAAASALTGATAKMRMGGPL